MHELSLIKDLFNKIENIAKSAKGAQVTQVHIQLGALAHISPEHFEEHFNECRENSAAQHAKLKISIATDLNAPDAQDIKLLSIDVAED